VESVGLHPPWPAAVVVVAIGMVEKAVLAETVVELELLPPPLEQAASRAKPAPTTTSVCTMGRERSIRSDSLRSGAPQVRAHPRAPARLPPACVAPQGGAVPSEHRLFGEASRRRAASDQPASSAIEAGSAVSP
jgi:hypothetical protein